MKALAGKIVRVDLTLLGERGYPLAQVKLPATVVADFERLVNVAVAVRPHTTIDDVVRLTWRLGSRGLDRGVRVNKAKMFSVLTEPVSTT